MKSRRVITFVPAEQAAEFATSMAEHIPHLFGNYDSVCWWSEAKQEMGTEQFRQQGGGIQQLPSVRMEFSIPDDDQAYTVFCTEIKKHHPWEQPVILSVDMDIENLL